jgi:hypothetical protein
MGNGESSPNDAEGENVSMALIRLKLAKSKGEITQEQYDAGNQTILSFHEENLLSLISTQLICYCSAHVLTAEIGGYVK